MKIIFFVLIAFSLSSCGVSSKTEQPLHPDFVRIQEGTYLGQTFTARYDGLRGISVFFKPVQDTEGEVSISIYEGNDSNSLLSFSSIESSEIQQAGYYEFPLEPISQSAGESYFFELTYNGSGNIRVGSAPGDTYLSGALYLDGVPQNSQSSFRLNYSAAPMFLGLLIESFSWFAYLILALLMFALPGWAALSYLLPHWKSKNWITKTILSIGIGISFYPVLYLWLDTLGINSPFLNALLLPILGLIFILINIFREPRGEKTFYRNGNKDAEANNFPSSPQNQNANWQVKIPDIVFFILLLAIIFTRFWPIRILDAPMWGDSYQHTMIAQLLSENGGLFDSWEPYAQLSSFTYHFGFHSLAANFHFLSSQSMIQSTLWVGQILNIFAICALYPLALMIGKNKWAGVLAVLTAGLLSSMPMMYVNWGRYTQLAGQVILPVIIYTTWENLDNQKRDFRWNFLVWLGLAGLALTHYRVTLFIPLFYTAYLLLHLREQNLWDTIKKTLIHASGLILITLPWLLRLFEGTLPALLGTQISTSASDITQTTQNLNEIGTITSYLPLYLWVLVILAILWGIITRNRKSMIFSFWWLLILLAANPDWLRLPGTGIITNFAVFIAAYIPAGILIGSSGADFLAKMEIISSHQSSTSGDSEIGHGNRRMLFLSLMLMIFTLLIGLWAVRPRIRDVRPSEHALLTNTDLRAANWIENNLPSSARFLVNSFFAYGGTLVAGSDGGWWLPLLTQRGTSQPPLLYGSEDSNIPNFVQFTNSLIAFVEDKGIDHPEVLSELERRKITHVFIGQQQGSVNTTFPLLDPQTLVESPNYSAIYHQDRVWIFSVVSGDS